MRASRSAHIAILAALFVTLSARDGLTQKKRAPDRSTEKAGPEKKAGGDGDTKPETEEQKAARKGLHKDPSIDDSTGQPRTVRPVVNEVLPPPPPPPALPPLEIAGSAPPLRPSTLRFTGTTGKPIVFVQRDAEVPAETKRDSDALVIRLKSTNPDRALNELKETVSSLAAIDAIPHTADEYRGAYGKNPEDLVLERPADFETKFGFKVITPHAEGTRTIADQVRQQVQHARATPGQKLFLLVHAENGFARFGDGSALAVGDLVDEGVFVIACSTANYAAAADGLQLRTNGDIASREAYGSVLSAGSGFRASSKDGKATMEDVARAVQRDLAKKSKMFQWTGSIPKLELFAPWS